MNARNLYDNSIRKVNLAGKWLKASHPNAIFYLEDAGLIYILELYDREKGGLQVTTYEIKGQLYTLSLAKTSMQANILKGVYHKCHGYEQISFFDLEVLKDF